MAADEMWESLQRGRVSDLIARRILDVIAKDQLRPGDRLPPERELAATLGASRPSLREALRSLKAQGRVDVRHGSGVYVADRKPPATCARPSTPKKSTSKNSSTCAKCWSCPPLPGPRATVT